jgi:dihydroxy-acid dehydratase
MQQPGRRKTPDTLRSRRWYGPSDLRSFGHRSRTAQLGFSPADYQHKPVIAIINTWNEISPCHSHLRTRAEEVKRGIWQAGGFPIELPAIGLSENFQKPTTMLYRNLLAMEVEELLRSYPADGAVLMGGCDKTTPALLMGAVSMNLPAIFLPAGAMLRGDFRGGVLGSGSDAWKYWDELRAGTITLQDWAEVENGIARSPGTCMTMGTAATMMSAAEALGFTLPGASSIPAPDSRHAQLASATGRRIVDAVWEDLKPSDLVTADAVDNAVTTVLALGGSTNAIVHLIAIARRAGIPLDLDRFDALSRQVPVIANLRPVGQYLMEDLFYAGGLRAALAELKPLLSLDARTINGSSLGENIAGATVHRREVIRSLADPIAPSGGLVVLRGNLAPDGAVMKPVAAAPHLLQHRGPALVFDSYAELKARIDSPDLEIDEHTVLILRNAGPQGGPGMPEWGQLPIPQKLLKRGVRDLLRISDARMSGTSYGACVLHVAPEAFVGGPLALVHNGDPIQLDVNARKLELCVDAAVLAERRARLPARTPRYPRGYGRLFIDHILQANDGCDFDFLLAGPPIEEPEIH